MGRVDGLTLAELCVVVVVAAVAGIALAGNVGSGVVLTPVEQLQVVR